ncbi:MAG: right-handed parallel beta-helix repeat-containing protein [Alphaproteobacteria bacterium]|nr:right-handed parallel beta-helix repeat-containing protein [Alphaproteobacteria bacterium]
MTTNAASWPRRLGKSCLRAAILIALPCFVALPSIAGDDSPPPDQPRAAAPAYDKDWYDSQPPDTHPNETASWFDPYDPVPGIDFPCRGPGCGHGPHSHHEEHPVLPGLLGHDAFLVDCGRTHSEPRRGVFDSLDEAAHFAPPNATILILPPGQGTTCVETVHIDRPLTIGSYGSAGRAVIQAPPGAPCLVAHIPLGDTLTIDGVRFVARSREAPCVAVEAGHVVVRNSEVDSRGSNWAFDVHESGELNVENTHIETDASGVHARRAHVELSNLDIDIDGRNGAAFLDLGRTDCTDRSQGTIHGSVGLALECSEGSVDGGSIIGGSVGILASAGTRGLRITDVKIRRADTAILLLPGQLGSVNVERPTIARSHDGIIIAPGAESQVIGGVITDSAFAGITAYGAGTLVSGNKIVGADDGIRLFAAEAFPPPLFPQFAAVPVIDGDDGGPTVENNLVANVRHAAVLIDGRAGGHQLHLHGRLIGNTFYARRPAECIDEQYNDDPVKVRANSCNREWLPWPF